MKIPTFFDFSVEKTSVFLKEKTEGFSFRKTEGSEIRKKKVWFETRKVAHDILYARLVS